MSFTHGPCSSSLYTSKFVDELHHFSESSHIVIIGVRMNRHEYQNSAGRESRDQVLSILQRVESTTDSEAVALLNQAAERLSSAGDRVLAARVLHQLGQTHLRLGDTQLAAELVDRAFSMMMLEAGETGDSLAMLSGELKRLRLLEKRTESATFEYDCQTRLLTLSKSLYDLLGLPPGDEMDLEQAGSLIHPDDITTVQRMYRELVDGQPDVNLLFRLVLPQSGEIRHIQGFAESITDQSGRMVMIIGGLQDITDNWQSEQEVVQSERFLQDLFDALGEGISVIDTSFRIMRVNSFMERMFAHKRPLIGRNCADLYDSGGNRCPWCPSRHTLETGEPGERIVPLDGQDGLRWVELKSYPLKGHDGIITGIIETVRDVTQRKQAESALLESEEKFRAIAENTPGLVFMYDHLPSDKRVPRYIGPGLADIIGAEAAMNPGTDFARLFQLIHPDDLEILRLKAEGLAEKKGVLSEEFRIFKPTRSGDVQNRPVKWIRCNARPKLLADGTKRWMGVLTDITVRKENELELDEYRNRLEKIVEERTAELKKTNRQLVQEIQIRQRKEEELDRSREYFLDTLNSLPNPVFVLDDKLTWSFINDEFCSFFNCRRDETLGKNCNDSTLLTTPIYKKILDVFHSGETVRFEEYVCLPDEFNKYVLIQISRHVDIDDQASLLGVISDLTQRKQMEQVLRRNKAILDETQQMVHLGGWELNLQTRELVWTSEVYRIHDVPTEYQPNMLDDMLFYHNEDVALLEDALQKVIEHKQPYDLELRFTSAAGRQLWVRNIGRPVTDSQGEVVRISGMIQDITRRKKAEKQLLRLEQAVEQSSDGIAVTDEEGMIQYVNPAWARMHRYEIEDLISVPMRVLMPESEHQNRFKPFMRKILDHGSHQGEMTFLRKSGKTFPVWLSASRLNSDTTSDLPGKEDGIVFLCRDITQQKETEDQLRFSDEILRNSKALVLTSDDKGDVRYISPSVTELLGYSQEDVFQKGWWQIAFPDPLEREPEIQRYQEMAARRRSITGKSYERRIPDSKGNIHWILFQDAPGPNNTVISIGQDISQRKKTEEELKHIADQLQASEQLLRRFAEAIPISCIIWEDDHVVFANPAYFQSRGLGNISIEEMKSVIEEFGIPFLHPEDEERMNNMLPEIQSTLERGEVFQMERRIRSLKTETYRWYNTYIIMPRRHESKHEVSNWDDGSFQPSLIIELDHDITERKQAQLALQRAKEAAEMARQAAENANRTKTRFLFNISHEIRTPLNCIIGFSEIILGTSDLADIHQRSQTILNESDILLMLINDLLDHAKLEAGKIELDVRPFSPRELIRSVKRVMEVKAAEKDLILETIVAEEIPDILMGDSLRLRQILINLVSNAIKFTETGSIRIHVVQIEGSRNYARLLFSVIDTGIGIPREKQKTIFQAFTQADGSTTRKYGGTGLGTTIAKEFIELMNGVIGLESEPGEGSTFWFEVPFDIALTNSGEPLSELEEDSGGLMEAPRKDIHLLLAEDYPPNQEVARMHLEGAGYEVDIASNGREAVRLAEELPYDMILMDVQMPLMDGFAATEAIKNGSGPNRETPIVGLTAHADSTTQKRCDEAGIIATISKPIRKITFLQKIRQCLTGKGFQSTVETDGTPQTDESTTPKSLYPVDLENGILEFGGNRELFIKVLHRFLDDLPGQIDRMDNALTSIVQLSRTRKKSSEIDPEQLSALEVIQNEAHKIRGGAANLLADPLAEEAEQLEAAAREKDYQRIRSVFPRFVLAFEQLNEYIRSYEEHESPDHR